MTVSTPSSFPRKRESRPNVVLSRGRQGESGAPPSRRVENIRREGHVVRRHHALRWPGIDAPLIVAARLPGPILGIADLVLLVHLLDLGGVFDHHLLGADEIGEDV